MSRFKTYRLIAFIIIPLVPLIFYSENTVHRYFFKKFHKSMISIHLHNPLLGVPREPMKTIHTEFRNVSSTKPFKFRKAKTSQFADVIVYNRVPKCGSTTMGFLLEALKQPSKHYFRVENQIQPGQSHRFQNEEEQNRWLGDIQNRTRPTVIVRHQFFTETKKTRSPEKRVLWINLVRDPVDQFISSYYYSAFKIGSDGLILAIFDAFGVKFSANK